MFLDTCYLNQSQRVKLCYINNQQNPSCLKGKGLFLFCTPSWPITGWLRVLPYAMFTRGHQLMEQLIVEMLVVAMAEREHRVVLLQ